MKQLLIKYGSLAIGVLLIAVAIIFYHDASSIDKADASKKLSKTILEKDQATQEAINRFNFNLLDSLQFDEILSRQTGEESLFTAIYEGNQLVFWSDNNVPIPVALDSLPNDTKIVRFNNGWYLMNRESNGVYTIVAASLIKTQYIYENKYLNSKFDPAFDFPYPASISVEEDVSGIPVELEGEWLFTVVVNPDDLIELRTNSIWPLIFMLGFGFLIIHLFRTAIQLVRANKQLLGLLIYCMPLILISLLLIWKGAPPILSNLEVFSPELYAQSKYLSSLGDLFTVSLIVFLVLYFLYRMMRLQDKLHISRPLWHYLLVLGGMILILWSATQINVLLKGLVINSQINFEITNLFALNLFSLIGILTIGLLLFSFLLISALFTLIVNRAAVNLNVFYFMLFILISCYVVYSLSNTSFDTLEIAWPLAILAIVVLINIHQTIRFTFAPVVALLIINALIAAHVVLKYSAQKELQERIVYAQFKLADDEDPVAEILFSEIEDELANSQILSMPFKDQQFDKAKFDHLLETRYFNGHWDQYEITYYLFDKDSLPLGLNVSTPKDYEELSDIITRSGIPSVHSDNIYHIPNYDNKLSYIINLFIPGENAEPAGFLFAELKSKKFPQDIGFPELLIDRETTTLDDLAGYSFARYLDGRVINKLGTYNYPIISEHIEKILGPRALTTYDDGGYNHLVHRISEKNIIVIGKPQLSFLEKATSFSYLFALFSLLLLLAVVLKEIHRISDLKRLSLKNKIQLVIISLILTCLILFGMGTRYFIEKQYNDKNNNLISEKIKSVSVEVKKKLKGVETITPSDYNYINSIMHKFSLVFFTDISMYDTQGTLIASSRNELFNAGLLSKKMAPSAYVALKLQDRSEYIQEENIGKMSYLSAYVPYINEKGHVLGYLNLPYFAKQNPLENEISDFLVAIINIFVVLFALSIVAALFVSNWVTKPLRLLQTSVSQIELGKENERIQYSGQDEIGDLVAEYNKKVSELEDAVSQLAQTERESAWRDMAKQVAHEIKNPLTPMKLSVQHFQRSFDKNSPDAEERIQRFASTLIEQIEALTSIANEFSSFAKMPTPQMEKVDLHALLEHVVELFSESEEASISLIDKSSSGYHIYHDKDHMIRVFNNLIKNALQAIPHGREGKIEVIIVDSDDSYLVSVKDNGSGIPPEVLEKIFVPNFTTKSKGMGIGLSMVRSIITNAGGEVWFETEVDKGTTFFVKIPRRTGSISGQL